MNHALGGRQIMLRASGLSSTIFQRLLSDALIVFKAMPCFLVGEEQQAVGLVSEVSQKGLFEP